MQNSETSMTNTVTLLDQLEREMPEINVRVVEEVRAANTRDLKESTANGQQDSEVLTENRVSELTVDTLIESPFRISRYPNSRFWAVYDGEYLVAVTVYRRGAEEVRRRLLAGANFRLSETAGPWNKPSNKP